MAMSINFLIRAWWQCSACQKNSTIFLFLSNSLQYGLRKGIIQIYIYSVANVESCLIMFNMNKYSDGFRKGNF